MVTDERTNTGDILRNPEFSASKGKGVEFVNPEPHDAVFFAAAIMGGVAYLLGRWFGRVIGAAADRGR